MNEKTLEFLKLAYNPNIPSYQGKIFQYHKMIQDALDYGSWEAYTEHTVDNYFVSDYYAKHYPKLQDCFNQHLDYIHSGGMKRYKYSLNVNHPLVQHFIKQMLDEVDAKEAQKELTATLWERVQNELPQIFVHDRAIYWLNFGDTPIRVIDYAGSISSKYPHEVAELLPKWVDGDYTSIDFTYHLGDNQYSITYNELVYRFIPTPQSNTKFALIGVSVINPNNDKLYHWSIRQSLVDNLIYILTALTSKKD